MRLVETIRPLMMAPVAAITVYVVFAISIQGIDPGGMPFLMLVCEVWAVSVAAGVIFVFPIFVKFPKARQPTLVVAAIWGGAVAYLSFMLASGQVERLDRPSVAVAAIWFGGAATGVVYTLLARRTPSSACLK
jgi:hypothetical protein